MLRVVLVLAWLILSCGQVILWWRRDNILAYLQAGFFFTSVAVPAFGTTILDDLDQVVVNRYADIMVVGAFAYVVGLGIGAALGHRWRLPRLNFGGLIDPIPALLVKRTRQVSLAGVVILVLSFALLGYIPFFTADRVSGKYGVGLYQAGFARGSLVLHVGLAVASTVLPVVLALLLRRRRIVDMILAGALMVCLVLTLSRGKAFIGPLVIMIAVAIERRWRPWNIVAAVCFAFIAGTLFNELVLSPSSGPGPSFALRVMASAPDLLDHVAFLDGYETAGDEQVGLKPIFASLSLDKGEFNGALYALRIRTGLPDVSGLAAGGLRLPAPLWGYASYGYPGLIVWSVLYGVGIGWGTCTLRRLLTPAHGRRGQALNLVLAWVFFEGTFLVLAEFYFFERVGLVSCALAFFLCWSKGPRGPADMGLEIRGPQTPAGIGSPEGASARHSPGAGRDPSPNDA